MTYYTYQAAYGFLYICLFATVAVCLCYCCYCLCCCREKDVNHSNQNHLNNSRTNEVVEEISVNRANSTMHHDPDDTTNDTTVNRDPSVTEEDKQPPSYEQVTLEDAIVLSRLELQEPPSYLVSSWDRCSKV